MTDLLQLNADGLLESSNGSTIPAEKQKTGPPLSQRCPSPETKPAMEAKEDPPGKLNSKATGTISKTNKTAKGKGNRRGIRRVIKATDSSRQVMRQVSGLGMVDPVYGDETEVANPQHPSNIFDDMGAEAIPEDMRETLSCCSDHTADENDGLDLEFFHQSLGTLHMSSLSHFSNASSQKSKESGRRTTRVRSHRSSACSRQPSTTSTQRSKAPSTRTGHQDWHASVTTMDTMILEDVVEDSSENAKERRRSGTERTRTAEARQSKRCDSGTAEKKLIRSIPSRKSASQQNQAPGRSSFVSPTKQQREISLNADLSPTKRRELPMCPEDIFGNTGEDGNSSVLDAMHSLGRRQLPKSPEKLFQTMTASMSQLDHLPDMATFVQQPCSSKQHGTCDSGTRSKDGRTGLMSQGSMSSNRTNNKKTPSNHPRPTKQQPNSRRKSPESRKQTAKQGASRRHSTGASSPVSPKKQSSKQTISSHQQPQQPSTSSRRPSCTKMAEITQTSNHSSRLFGHGGNAAKFTRLPSNGSLDS